MSTFKSRGVLSFYLGILGNSFIIAISFVVVHKSASHFQSVLGEICDRLFSANLLGLIFGAIRIIQLRRRLGGKVVPKLAICWNRIYAVDYFFIGCLVVAGIVLIAAALSSSKQLARIAWFLSAASVIGCWELAAIPCFMHFYSFVNADDGEN